jgi:hypothetical protein
MKFKDAQTMAIHKFDTEDFLTNIKEEDETMIQHLPILKKMNEKGFITHNSQAGRKSKGISVLNNKPYVMEERAFVDGFMPYKKAVTFLKKMNLYTDKNAINIMDSPQFLKSEFDIPLTITTQNNKTNIHTHMSLSLPIQILNSYKRGHKINQIENVVYIFCWDSIWNRNASNVDGLFTDVLRNL